MKAFKIILLIGLGFVAASARAEYKGTPLTTNSAAAALSYINANLDPAAIKAIGDPLYDPINSALAVQTYSTGLSNAWVLGSNNLQTAISQNVQTNDTRTLNFSNLTNKMNGAFSGTFTQSGSLIGGTANPYTIGLNSGIGVYVTGSTAGQEIVTHLISPWENQWSMGNGFPVMSFFNGVGNDYDLRIFKRVTVMPNNNVDPTKFTVQGNVSGNIGAPLSSYSPFPQGSAGPMIDLPIADDKRFKNAMPEPWWGLTTDDATQTGSDSNPAPMQTNILHIPDMANMFRTSNITPFLAAYGTAPNIFVDGDWEWTNRTASGVIQENTNIFIGGMSNVNSIVHTNGATIVYHIYHTSGLPNQFPSAALTAPDTAWRTSPGGHFWNSYPSGVGAQAGYQTNFCYPAITADTVPIDILMLQTNGADGFMDADIDSGFAEHEGYEHDRLVSDADAILYPQTKNGGRVFWRNYTYPDGSGNNDAVAPTTFPTGPQLNHQLWFGYFANHPSSEVSEYANFTGPDQLPAVIPGVDAGLQGGEAYAYAYESDGATNWPVGTFPLFTVAGGTAQDIGWTLQTWTNYCSYVGEFNGCSMSGWHTNTWNHLQDGIVTNANFLSAWLDVSGGFPKTVWHDALVTNTEPSNSLYICALKDGFKVLAGNLSSVSSNYNSSLVVKGGIASNVVYNATNILSQTPFNGGLITNNFIYSVPANSCVWVKLTPALPQVRIFAGSGISVTKTNRADPGGVDYGLTVTGSGTGNFNGPASSTTGDFVSFSDTTGVNGADSGKSAASFDTAGTATAVTNGYPWGTLYDAANSAHNSTNGYPWGSLYDAANSAHNATNGYPWGSLYDSANAAHNATNSYPWLNIPATNYVSYTHEGTGTNISVILNGTLQSFTVTNGPDVFVNWSGAGGSASFQILTNVSIHSTTTFAHFLSGSNGVSAGVYKITNGVFSVTSYGGTNSAQMVPAIGEYQ